MPPLRQTRRGRPGGALVVFAGLLLLAALPLTPAAAACPADRVDARVLVEYVHDGDTVRLADGRSLRLIGINTPELGRDGRPDEPLASAARSALRRALGEGGMRLDLRYDAEREDRYGRTLAHAFLVDGRSVSALLLEQGLAVALVVPPNEWSWACYREREREARRAARGVWSLPRYRPLEAAGSAPFEPGFRLLRGTVRGVQRGRGGVRLELEQGLGLWLGADDLGRFPPPESLLGQRVEARGWLSQRGGRWQMRVRHPALLESLAGP